MQDKIKAQLKTKFPGVNLSKERLDAIADKLSTKITEESEIDAKLDELNDLYPFADIAKNDDRERTKKTVQQKQPKQDETPTEEPDLKAMYLELKKELEAQRLEKQKSALQEKLLKQVSDKKIPASFVKGRTIESEDQLDSVLQEIETDFTAVKQELVNQGFSQSTTPIGGVSTIKTDSVDKDIEAWAKKNAIPQTKNN
jgi:hypothetical protein